ncbi:MAG: c-type cytochrome, partial [Ardenticatenaceae bacterium]
AELAVLGALFLGVGMPLGGWYRRRGAAVMGPGIAAFLVGVIIIANTQLADTTLDDSQRNPFPPNRESLEIGMRVYAENCQVCHGLAGRGDGPGAEGLDPPPADLILHVPLHSDGALFDFIHDGIPGTAMAPLGDTLTDEEIWHVINYVRTLE